MDEPSRYQQFRPAYLALHVRGELAERADKALAHLATCDLCPRNCGVDRLSGETGVCRTGRLPLVASAGPHFGEEAPLVGRGGSGTIFFACCNLRCVFCQNAEISQLDRGREVGAGELAAIMLELQASGCENINFVSPTHVVAPLLEALSLAAEAGLRLPLVYNTGGYDSETALRLLDGVVDIYMPDMKYGSDEVAARLSGVHEYTRHNQAAVKEMHRQVGNLELDGRGVAMRGLLVRHLVLPRGLAGSAEVARFLAQEISVDTYINVMDQYYPSFQAYNLPDLGRRVNRSEYSDAVRLMTAAGLRRLDKPIELESQRVEAPRGLNHPG